MPLPGCPRLIVIAPTEELVQQARRLMQALARAGLPLRSAVMTGGRNLRSQKETLAGGVDVVFATPRRLRLHLEEGNLRLDACRAIVLDEVDVLVSDTGDFKEDMAWIRRSAPATRFVMATATLPHSIYLDLLEEFPFLEVFQGPGLHRNPPGVTEQIVDCSGGDEISPETGFQRKSDALLGLLRSSKAARCIVFCNRIDSCRKVENLLRRSKDLKGLKVLPYHSAMGEGVREKNLAEFLSEPKTAEESYVLICTDRASRGIDTSFVEHVVLFDFPRDPSEYVRRVGRTARGAGGKGLVSSLVLGRQVGLAQNIINRNQRGLPIHKVPSI